MTRVQPNPANAEPQICGAFKWCEGYGVDRDDHEHSTSIRYVPATLSAAEVEINGITFPTVGVGISYFEPTDSQPSIWVHISGANRDADAHMRPEETRALIAALTEALASLEAS